jgi:hypothetical protein
MGTKSVKDLFGELRSSLAVGYEEFAVVGTDLGC